MKRVLLLIPMLVVPPLLVAAYFLYVEGARLVRPTAQAADAAGTGSNLQAARIALERANQFLNRARQARPGQSTELLTQAVVQYRVCLAYELAAPGGGCLFEDARRNLEVSRLLLEQSTRPTPARNTDTVLARATPPAPPATPPASKAEAVPVHSAPVIPPASKLASPPEVRPVPALPAREKKEPTKVVTPEPPVPAEEPAKPTEVKKPRMVHTTTFGPDGIEYETIRAETP